MNAEALVEQLFHFFVPRAPNISSKRLPLRVPSRIEILGHALQEYCFAQGHRGLDGLFPSVDEYHDLVTFSNQFQHLFVDYSVEVLFLLRAVGLSSHSKEMLFQRDGSEGLIEVEQPRITVNATNVIKYRRSQEWRGIQYLPKEVRDIDVVGQGCR